MGPEGDTYTQPLCGLMGSGVTPRLSLSVDVAPSCLTAVIHFVFTFSEGLVSCRGELAWEDEGRCRSHSERKWAELWPRAQVPIKLPFDRNLVLGYAMVKFLSLWCSWWPQLPSRYPFHDVLAVCPLKGAGNQDLKVTKGTHPAVTATWLLHSSHASSGSPPTLEKLTRVMTMKCPHRRPHWRCPGDAHAPSTSVPTEHLPFVPMSIWFWDAKEGVKSLGRTGSKLLS